MHLAYRIIDLIGGHMDISSAPGQGCIVNIEVPVLRRSPLTGPPLRPSPFPLTPTDMSAPAPIEPIRRKIALVGFNRHDKHITGLPRLGETLERQYSQLGCEVVTVHEADLIIANGDVEEIQHGAVLMEKAKTDEIIFLTLPGHDPHPEVSAAARKYGKYIRRIAKPVTPSVVRQTLGRPRHHIEFPSGMQTALASPDINRRSSQISPHTPNGETRTPNGHAHSNSSGTTLVSKEPVPSQKVKMEEVESRAGRGLFGGFSNFWRSKGMCPEEAIACLSLGDYFSARRRGTVQRTSSVGSSARESSHGETSTPTSSNSGLFDNAVTSDVATPDSNLEDDVESEDEPAQVKVLVVEDNMINRKILVRILSTKLVRCGSSMFTFYLW